MQHLYFEMRQQLRFIFGFASFIIVFLGSSYAKLDVASKVNTSFTDLMDTMPKSLQVLFDYHEGINPNTVTGYTVMNMSFVLLILAFFAVMITLRLFSISNKKNAQEFVCTKPISYHRIYVHKLLVFVLSVTFIACISGILPFIALYVFKQSENQSTLFHFGISGYVLSLLFGSISLYFLIVFKKRYVPALMYTMIFATFILSKIAAFFELEKMKYILLYSSFSFEDMVLKSVYPYYTYAVFLLISCIVCALGYYYYEKKDKV